MIAPNYIYAEERIFEEAGRSLVELVGDRGVVTGKRGDVVIGLCGPPPPLIYTVEYKSL